PNWVFFNETRGTVVNYTDLDATNEWNWSNNVLYVYSASDPDTQYTSPGIEVNSRNYGIYNSNSADNITIQNLEIEGGLVAAIYSDQNNAWTIDNNTVYGAEQYNIFGRGNPSGAGSITGWQVINNTVGRVECSSIGTEIRSGIAIRGATSPLVTNNYVETVNAAGIIISSGTWNGGATSATATVTDNEINNSQSGILIKNTTDSEVHRNYIHDGKGFGLAFNTNATGAKATLNLIHDLAISDGNVWFNGIDINYDSDDGELYGNTVYGVYRASVVLEAGTGSSPSDGWIIKNNIFDSTTNTKDGAVNTCFHIDQEVTNYTLGNNIYNFDVMIAETEFDWRQSWSAWQTFLSGVANASDSGIEGATSVYDPLFVTAGSDFTLNSTSPAIDRGTDVGLTQDYAGNSVPVSFAPDIGAYEYYHNLTYYVDSTSGNNSDNGITTSTPWQNISEVNAKSFIPGSTILFKRGETWREQLTVPSSGNSTHQITFGAYGTGAKPIIDGSTEEWTMGAEEYSDGDDPTGGGSETEAFDSTTKTGGTFNVSTSAAYTGSKGIRANITSGSSNTYGTIDWGNPNSTVKLTFRFRFSDISTTGDCWGYLLKIWDGATYNGALIWEQTVANGFRIKGSIVNDAGSGEDTSLQNLTVDTWYNVTILWKASTSGSTDGFVLLKESDSASWKYKGDIDNDATRNEYDKIEIGVFGNADLTGGKFDFDDIVIESLPNYAIGGSSKDYISLRNIVLKNARKGIYNDQGDSWIIDNNTITDVLEQGILSRGNPSGAGSISGLVVSNNIIDEVQTNPDINDFEAGVSVRGASNPLIYRNNISVINCGSITTNTGGASGTGAMASGYFIYENIINRDFEGGIQLFNTDSSKIYFNRIQDGKGGGISIQWGSDSNEIFYNLIHNLSQNTNDDWYNGIDINHNSQNGTVYGNTVAVVERQGLTVENDTAACDGWIIKNNIFYSEGSGTDGAPIQVNSGVSNITLSNNIYFPNSNRGDGNVIGLLAGVDQSTYSTWKTGIDALASGSEEEGLTSDPLFTDPNNNNFTLQATSPAIDAGEDLGAAYDDGLDNDSVWPNSVLTLDQD
ncbi:MAG: right-handed parallel beta-helix repeat-containing protein, partial [Candidatus Hodarchaeales archaeon]